MSDLHLRQIRKKLEQDYVPSVDLTDYEGKSASDRDTAALSRSLAAFAVADRLGLEPTRAARTVTDGFGDNGIDAIGLDTAQSRVVVAQSKWIAAGKGAPTVGDVQKFAQGFRDLINGRFRQVQHCDKGEGTGTYRSARQH